MKKVSLQNSYRNNPLTSPIKALVYNCHDLGDTLPYSAPHPQSAYIQNHLCASMSIRSTMVLDRHLCSSSLRDPNERGQAGPNTVLNSLLLFLIFTIQLCQLFKMPNVHLPAREGAGLVNHNEELASKAHGIDVKNHCKHSLNSLKS